MTRALLALLVAAACAAPAFAEFSAGVLEPVTPGVAAEVRRLGLALAPSVPEGGAEESAAGAGGGLADFSRLRFLLWRAAARRSPGVWFRLPPGEPLDFPEEWQALSRVGRELTTARPILEEGSPAPEPFAAPPGVLVRSWSRGGRRYVLLVNEGSAPAPFEPALLVAWRALFAVRADARQLLAPCGDALCLSPEGVLWLEGRPSYSPR